MNEPTIEDYISYLEDAKCRLDDAIGDVTEAERELEEFCEENDIEYIEE